MTPSKTITKAPRFLRAGVLNVVLRGLSLGSKLVLMVAMARALPIEDVGEYGLMVVTVGLAMSFLGFEFYTFSGRDMLSKPEEEWPTIIRDQLVFYLLAYLVLLPVILVVFAVDLLPWRLVCWFYVILAFEHLSQEGYRLLITIGRPLFAGWVLFLRYGGWAYFLTVVFWLFPERASLLHVWLGWALGGCSSILLVLWGIRGLEWQTTRARAVDWDWVRCGVKVAIPFFAGALALRGLFAADRYLLDFYHGRQAVGVYTFFMGLAFALNSFVDSGVVVIYYPKIVAAFRQGRVEEYRKMLRAMALSIALVIVTFCLCAYLAIPLMLNLIERPLYAAHLDGFWVLLVAIGIYCFSVVPHMALYARHADFAISAVTIGALLLFVSIAMILVPPFGFMGMALSQVVTMTFLLVAKLGCLSRCR